MKRRHFGSIVFAIAAVVVVVALRRPLVEWFSGGGDASPPAPATPGSGAAHPPAHTATPTPDEVEPPALPTIELAPPALTTLRRALDASEQIRAVLAIDKIDGIATYARELVDALRSAPGGLGVDAPEIRASLARAATASDALAASLTVDGARTAFGNVSLELVALATADPRLRDGWYRFDCSMATGFGGWLQRSPDIENPYMGTSMPRCGSAEPWQPAVASAAAPLSHEGHGHAGDDVAYYTCPMHPSVHASQPGACPICGMKLTDVTFDQVESGTILVDDSRRAVLGIQTSKAEVRPLTLEVRGVGRVTYDETRLQDVTLKVRGWVTRLDVNTTGQAVARGQRLMTLYSPELFAAQQEYLLALKAVSPTGGGAPDLGRSLADASARKLELLGMTAGQLAELRRRGRPTEDLPILSPAGGYVIEKAVVQGAAVEPGQRLYRIAALDQVWLDAAVYEQDLPHVQRGQDARISIPHAAPGELTGKVAVVFPYLEAASRTGTVRIELPNKELALKPDMYADVVIDVDLGPRLAVPVSAVVYTGTRRIVFLELGGGRFRPQEVQLGARAGPWFEVKAGLTAGQAIVTEGNFLIAAESRIRSAAYWEDGDDAR